VSTALHGTVSDSAVDTCSFVDDDWRWRYARGACLKLTDQPQCLFDDYLVEDVFNLRRVVTRPQKHPRNPVLAPELPWEWSQGPCSIIYDRENELFRMRFSASSPTGSDVSAGEKPMHRQLRGYAISRDAIHWHKPTLEEVQQASLRRPMATDLPKVGPIDLEPDVCDPPRYFLSMIKQKVNKDGAWDLGAGAFLRYSPDGLHWQQDPRPLLMGVNDTWLQPIYDPHRKHWLLFRRGMTRAVTKGFTPWHNLNRRPTVCVGKDLFSFGQPQTLRLLDETDVDLADGDGWYVFRWGDMLIGSLGVMDHFATQPKNEYLTFSRDGVTWQRLPDRQRFLPLGEEGQWDAGQVTVTHVMNLGAKTYIYYRGTRYAQGNYTNNSSGLGVAWVPRDRWVAQVGDDRGGFLLTRRLLNEADELVINGETTRKHGGILRGEVLKPSEGRDHLTAQPYPGFAFADCDPSPYRGDDRFIMRWNGRSIGELRGKPVMLRLHLQNFKVYTVKFETSP
jgi:hypothetical protein